MKKKIDSRMRCKRGSALVGAALLAIIAAGMVGAYLSTAFNELKLSQRTSQLHSAMNLAEAGLEEAMLAINSGDMTSWTSVGSNGYYREISDLAFLDSRTGPVRVYFEFNGFLPTIVSEGRIVDVAGGEISRQIRVDLKQTGLFHNGMTAKETISFGGSVKIDAYDSNVGLWNASTNRLDEVTVATLAVNNGAADIGNADIWGYLATGGGTPDIGASGSVMGEESVVSVDPNRISDDFYANLPDVSVPTGTVEGINYIVDYTSLAIGDIGATGTPNNPEVYHISSFSMGGSSTLRIVGPTVIIVDGLFQTGGSSVVEIVQPNGTLELYAKGDIDIRGGGTINVGTQPEALVIWGAVPTGTSQSISVGGGNDTAAIIYAPNADVTYGGSSELSGSLVGKTIDFQGSPDFHYDIRLKGFTQKGSYSIERWREMRGASEELDFTSTAALASSVSPL